MRKACRGYDANFHNDLFYGVVRLEEHLVHGKRNVVENDRLLTAEQLAQRVCAYFACSYKPHLVIPEKVARLCTRIFKVLSKWMVTQLRQASSDTV